MPHTKKPIRILIIDDDEDDFILTSSFINGIPDYKFELGWCYQYHEAVELIRGKKYDLYFIDYRLGAKTGIDLLREVCGDGCEEPIILLTGKGNTVIDNQAMQLGAMDYLVKSDLTSEKLERCIRYSIERSNTMKALKANERRYRNIFEKSKEAVFTTDEQLHFTDINSAMCRLVGAEKQDVIAQSLFSFIDNDGHIESIRKLIAEGQEVVDFNVDIIHQSGKKRNCILYLDRETNSDGQSYLQGMLHDVTTQRRTERSTLLAEKLAATGRLVRTLAHEVRNPLSNIHMSLEQLAYSANDEDKIYLNIIDRNGRRINDLITELLTSSRPSEVAFRRVSLQQIVESTISAAFDRITLKQIQVSVNAPEVPYIILADPDKLKIALLNIVINAVEAMENGKGSLQVQLNTSEEAYVLEITDNGCGIPSENLGRLFEPYFTSKRNGIGLGLASALNILQAHQATVEVKSRLGEGTTFAVAFVQA